tara:strand:+ start:992 stop:1255 length:264 start_codon:yes stop_codon:yes gene_type:complete
MNRDKIIERVINKIKSRSDVGYAKYKVTLHDDNQPLDVWLTHIQEELMDAVNYIEKAKAVLTDEVEEIALKRFSSTDDIEVHEEEIL